MLNKTYQSMIRLLSVGTISLGMLLSGAGLIVPPVPTALAQAAATAGEGGGSAHAQAIPDTNPYADPTQCVYGAWQFAAEAGHKLPWFAGNATDWKEGAREHGLEVVDTISPDVVHGIAVWHAGVGGTGSAGHVGFVEQVDGNRFLVKDRNWVPAADDERWVTWEEGISFIVLEKPQQAPA